MFSDINIILFRYASDFYERDSDAREVDLDVVMSTVTREMPRQEEVMRIALDRIAEEVPISINNIVAEWWAARAAKVGSELATAILNGREVTELLASYNSIMERGVEGEIEDTSDVVVWEGLSVDSLREAVDPSNLIPLHPPSLNERVGGGAMRGSHILIYARPETGKTLLAINMGRGLLGEGYRVLYIGNEDPSPVMRSRMMGSITGKTRAELLEAPSQEVNRELLQGGGEGFVFVHLEPGSWSQIRGLVETHQPDVLIVDQIRNIGTADGLTTSQERGGIEMRNIANRYNLVAISLAQAGESGSGKLVLGLSDIDSSKTGLPAQVDLMVGIGISEEYESRGKRMVSLPKNKLSGDHSFFSISVNEQLSRVEED